MSYPGEYPRPLVRVTNVLCPIVSGYVTARLFRQDPLFVSGTVDAQEDAVNAQFTLENTGSKNITVLLQHTDRDVPPGTDSTNTPTGTRIPLGGVTLVPGGVKTLNLLPYLPFLEVFSPLGSGNPGGNLRMQIASKIQWDILGFDKADPTYAQVLRDIKPIPAPPNAVFPTGNTFS